MSKRSDERRCKTCNKLLLDEKLPICQRCSLNGRNYVFNGLKIAGGAFAAVFFAKATVNSVPSETEEKIKDKKKKNVDDEEEDEEEE